MYSFYQKVILLLKYEILDVLIYSFVAENT